MNVTTSHAFGKQLDAPFGEVEQKVEAEAGLVQARMERVLAAL